MEKYRCIVHFLPAKAGDCFVIEFNDKNCILIDGGYPSTYRQELKPLLQKLAQKGCRVALMIVTHIDADHILGAIHFLEENGDARNPKIIPVDEVWYNGIVNTILNSEFLKTHETKEVPEVLQQKWKQIRGKLKCQFPGEEGYISAGQCKQLEEICIGNHYRVNGGSLDKQIEKGERFQKGDCEIRVLSPEKTQIIDFQKKLHTELIKIFGKEYLWNRTDGFIQLLDMIARYKGMDKAGTFVEKQIGAKTNDIKNWVGTSTLAEMNTENRVSIVVEINYKGLRLLFSGDSESAIWAEQLAPKYDLIKVSHHGSTKPNLAWMKATNAQKLLISTNGQKNRHPEDDFLARAMMGNFGELYFNYDIRRKNEILKAQETYYFKAEFGTKEIILE